MPFLVFTTPLPALLLLTPCSSSPPPSATTAAPSPSSPSHHAAARAAVRPEMDSPCSPLSVAPPLVSRHGPERLLGRAPMSHRRGPIRDPPWTSAAHGPRMVDRVHHIFPLKKIPRRKIPTDFAVSPLPFYEIKPQSMKIPRRPLVFKNKIHFSHSHFPEIIKKSPQLLFAISSNRNSDFDDSCAKILRITSSFILCIH
jgi:hypothetical protein